MAMTESEEKIARLLQERLAEIDQLRALSDELHPTFRRWRERLVTLLKEGVRQGVLSPDLVSEIEYQQFAESRIRMHAEPDRCAEDWEYYFRGLDAVAVKLEAELERIEEFGSWGHSPAAPTGRSRASRRRANERAAGPVTNINVRDIINQGGLQLAGHGNVQNNVVRWDSMEATTALEQLVARVKEIQDDGQSHVLELIAEMKTAKHHDERLAIADQLDKFVKLAPAFRWVWQMAKPHVGL